MAVHSGRRKSKSLAEIFFLKEGVLEEDGRVIGIGGHDLKNASDRDAHPADAGLAATFSRFNRDAV